MQRISVEDVQVGMLLHDEEGPETFVVTNVNKSEHSTQIYGTTVRSSPIGTAVVALGEHRAMYINGDSGLWRLDD